MTTVYKPHQGTLEMALRAFQALAESAAFTAEVHDRWLLMTTQAPVLSFTDVNGAAFQVNMEDTTYGGVTPDQWMHDTFAEVRIEDVGDPETLTGSWPQMRIVPGRGRVPPLGQDEGHGIGIREWEFPVECAVLTSQDQPQAAQREALVLAEAYESLLRRNEYLGGMVELCKAEGPVQPGGYGPVGNVLLAVAVQRFQVRIVKE